ncbi:beta-2 adrenergic receptor-like [Glandiceps talaboti]
MTVLDVPNITRRNDSDENCDADMIPSYIIVAVVSLIIMLSILFGNILVIISIYRFQHLQTVTNYFICSLACADLLVIMTVIMNGGLVTGMLPKSGNIYYCLTQNMITNSGCLVSICHLLIIAVDRYIAITSPLTYHSRMTTRKAKIIISILWALPLLFAVSRFITLRTTYSNIQHLSCYWVESIQQRQRIAVFVVSFICPLVVMSLLYMYIFWIVRKQNRKISSEHQSANTPAYKRDIKAVKTLAIILCTFIICWSPVYIFRTFLPHKWPTCGTPWLSFSLLSLAISNSAMNPAIYAFKNTEFRDAFRKLLK